MIIGVQKERFSFSQDFIQKLIDYTGGSVPSETYELVIDNLLKEADKYFFTPSSEANLLRIFAAVYDKSLFISELSRYPHHIEIITAIAANSNYLTDIVVRNPEYLYQVFDQTYLTEKYSFGSFKNEITTGAGKFNSLPAKLNFLRQAKKRFTLKIGLTDILGLDELYSVTAQLSFLAKAINAELFELCYNEILTKYNINFKKVKYCLCSLGKLGGNELNYSSDVDMILFFDENTNLKKIKKEYQEILAETALLYIKSSTAVTDRGYIYRVDFRLRPDGKYSPLCKALHDYTKYYETRGEDWERQMLIKLDFVCGNESLYKNFHSFLLPYIFPNSFSTSLKDQIKKMKRNIEKKNEEKDDVKLFSGGIRDIEFSVQALQLLNGGRYKDLRTGNSLDAINLLNKKNLLHDKEKDSFIEAYTFYRKIEHFLQLMNDTQTHTIPSEGELLNKLSKYLGFDSAEDFKTKLAEYRTKVRGLYDEILFTEQHTSDAGKEIEFIDKNKAEKNFQFIGIGTGISGQKGFDARTIGLYSKIEPYLIEYLKNCTVPDKVLDNFTKVIHSTSFVSIWYNELTNQKFFKLLLEICEYSQKAIDFLSSDKMLEEFFLSRRVFIKNPESELESFTTNQLQFMLAVQFAFKLKEPADISKLLCDFVTIQIEQTVKETGLNQTFFIGALGSYGSYSMNYSSDIDLIVVADDVTKYKSIQSEFQNFIGVLQKKLKPFEVDFRLRPEGKKSQLVWDIENYQKYINDRARIWEFQSLLKLRYITGDKKIFGQLKNSILKKIKTLDGITVRTEVHNMLKSVQNEFISKNSFNIKKHKYGLFGIDFTMQTLSLLNDEFYKKCMGENITGIIDYSINNGFPNLAEFKDNYLRLRKLEFAVMNIFNSSTAAVPNDKIKRNSLTRFLNLQDDIDLYISKIVDSNKILINKYLGA